MLFLFRGNIYFYLYHDYQNEADSMAGADGASPALKNGNVNAAGVG